MKSFLLAAALVALVPACAGAESQSLSFEEVAREALSHGPEAGKIGLDLAERAAEAFGARVKENPVINLGGELPVDHPSGGREDPGVSLSVSQAIRPSDFGQRMALAALIQQTGDAEQVLALNELLSNLAMLYARAWGFQETEKLLNDARTRVSRILKRVTTGQGSQGAFGEGDIQLLRSELESFEADGVAARGDLARSLAELTRLSGVALSGRTLQKLPDAPLLARDEFERLVRESRLPIQKRFQLLRTLSQKRVEVARLDAFPAVSPQVGYAHHDDGANQVVVGFSVPLTIFNRNEAESMRAQGELAAAERGERYATSDAIVTEALLLYDAAQDTTRQVEIYETKVLPAKTKAVEAYYRQFEGGAATAFQLWQAQRDLNDTRRRALELRVTLAGTRAQINALIGEPQL